jgi:hypothetical protein
MQCYLVPPAIHQRLQQTCLSAYRFFPPRKCFSSAAMRRSSSCTDICSYLDIESQDAGRPHPKCLRGGLCPTRVAAAWAGSRRCTQSRASQGRRVAGPQHSLGG